LGKVDTYEETLFIGTEPGYDIRGVVAGTGSAEIFIRI
jgi:hypothetical protein